MHEWIVISHPYAGGLGRGAAGWLCRPLPGSGDPSAVSRHPHGRDRMDAPLFARTTRSVALTEAGERFIEAIAPAFADIADAVERLQAARGHVTGVLRLNVPRTALPIAITPVLAELSVRHPGLIVEVTSDDSLTDIVAGSYDAGVRLGGMIAQDMVALRLSAPFKAIMVASPAISPSAASLARSATSLATIASAIVSLPAASMPECWRRARMWRSRRRHGHVTDATYARGSCHGRHRHRLCLPSRWCAAGTGGHAEMESTGAIEPRAVSLLPTGSPSPKAAGLHRGCGWSGCIGARQANMPAPRSGSDGLSCARCATASDPISGSGSTL